jgi:hypothetical protein
MKGGGSGKAVARMGMALGEECRWVVASMINGGVVVINLILKRLAWRQVFAHLHMKTHLEVIPTTAHVEMIFNSPNGKKFSIFWRE